MRRWVATLCSIVLTGCTCAAAHEPVDGSVPAIDAGDAGGARDAPASLGACGDPATWSAEASNGAIVRVEPFTHCASGFFDVLVRYVLRAEASRACLRVVESTGGAPAPGTTYEMGADGLAIRLAAGDAIRYEARYVDARGALVDLGRAWDLDVEAGATSAMVDAPLTGLGEAFLAGGTRAVSHDVVVEVGAHDAAARMFAQRFVIARRTAAGVELALFHDTWDGGDRSVLREGVETIDDPGGAMRFLPGASALVIGTRLVSLGLDGDGSGAFSPSVDAITELSAPVRDAVALGRLAGLALLEDGRVLLVVGGRPPRELGALPFVAERLLGGAEIPDVTRPTAAIADATRVARVRVEGSVWDAPEVIFEAPAALPSGIGTPLGLAEDGTVIGTTAAANELPAAHGPTHVAVPTVLGVEILATHLQWAAIRRADGRIGLWARTWNDPGCEL